MSKPARYCYDPACEELARHFLGDRASRETQLVPRLAQHIQNQVESWIEYELGKLAKAAKE